MRFLLKAKIPVQTGNASIKEGKLADTIQAILEDIKPEAVYFSVEDGQRTAFIFVDLQEASQIPTISEPWFLAFDASIEICPVMLPEDLGKAQDFFAAAVQKYN